MEIEKKDESFVSRSFFTDNSNGLVSNTELIEKTVAALNLARVLNHANYDIKDRLKKLILNMESLGFKDQDLETFSDEFIVLAVENAIKMSPDPFLAILPTRPKPNVALLATRFNWCGSSGASVATTIIIEPSPFIELFTGVGLFSVGYISPMGNPPILKFFLSP